MLYQDFRHALRGLRRAGSFTTIAVLTAALGIGAGTSLFSVVKAVLLNPLPYPEADRLAWVASVAERSESRTSLADFDDWRARNRSFASLAAYSDAPFLAGGGVEPQHVQGTLVSEDFFDVFGVRPAMGRVFTPEEHRQGTLAAVVLSNGLWQRAYGEDAHILGRKITLLGMKSTVIGVMPKGFAYPAGADLWVALRPLNEGFGRTAHNFWVAGRMRAGVTVEAARRDIDGVAAGLKKQYPGPFQTDGATASTLSEHLLGSVRTPLLVLFAAVGLLLVIVCVNIANLLLVRVASRSGELAVRAALGAGAGRLFAHLLTESLVLAAAGGALGLILASWSTELFRVLLPASLPRGTEVQLDGGVVLFAIAVTMLAGILFGTMPSWMASRLNILEVFKSNSRSHTGGRGAQRVQSALVISEVALSVLLLAGAGVLVSSFARLRAVDPGFRTDRVLAADVTWPSGPAARFAAQYREVLGKIRALPGVAAAGAIKDVPLDAVQRSGHFFIEGRPEVRASEAGFMMVSPGLMETLRIPLRSGRRFTDADTADSELVAMVSEGMARKYWPDRDPIGQRIWFDSFDPETRWLTVVGVAGDVRQMGLPEPAREQAYVCAGQLRVPAFMISGTLMVRRTMDPRALTAAVRQAVRDVNPQAAAGFRKMDDVLAAASGRQRFQLQILGAFAILALVLAAIGLYGVLSYTVTSGRGAIGIRIALGAQARDIFGLVARRAVALVLTGAAIGCGAWLAVGGVLKTVVFGVESSEPQMLGAAAAIMAVVALVACWAPARRAMRVDPAEVLRGD